MKYEKILKHPDRDKLLDLLSDQKKSLRYIENYTKEKYPNDPTYHVSETTLRKFMKEGAGIIREQLTQSEIKKALKRFVKTQNVPDKFYRNYTAPSKYVVEDHAALAAEIQVEMDQLILKLSYLFLNALEATSNVLEGITEGYRDAKDLKQMTSATKDISDMYQLYAGGSNSNKEEDEDSFDSFMRTLDQEEEHHD